ncbi:MAG: polyketide cyclase [Actinomycetota bacterium]|nr:polyketide cyclase [Actinomycetota bacterium]
MSKSVAVTVTGTAHTSSERTFDTIVPIDLPSVFRGYGPLPAVTRTTDQTGAWDAVGQSRTVHLSDGSSAPERINSYGRPGSFGYRVGPFTGMFGRIVEHADGLFIFEESGGSTHVSWTYTFRARPGRGPLLPVVAILWRRYATRVLDAMIAGA